MRERYMGKGASLGKEVVLAASGRAGEVDAGAERMRRATFSAFCLGDLVENGRLDRWQRRGLAGRTGEDTC